jgi:hypothetical protein
MKMENQIAIPDEIISNRIYLIRNQKVMIDKDLAELYQVQTSQLNRAVMRNIKRLPEKFMFQLTENEFKILIYQNGISSCFAIKAGIFTWNFGSMNLCFFSIISSVCR